MHEAVAGQRLLPSLAFCSTQMAPQYSAYQYRMCYESCYASMKQIHSPQSAQQQFNACPSQMFNSEGFILIHLPSLPVLWPQIRIIRCIQTSGTLTDTHTRTHTLTRFMFPSLSCLYHSRLVLLVSSAALSTRKNRKKKSPLL